MNKTPSRSEGKNKCKIKAYVDDCLVSAETIPTTAKHLEKAKLIFSMA